MKIRLSIMLLFVSLAYMAQACAISNIPARNNENHKSKTDNKMETKQFYIHVNGHTLTVDLKENSSVQAVVSELKAGDIIVPMKDYADFEKFGELPRSFPRNDEQIITESGDVILSEGNLLVIYYDRNSWSFTRLGKIRGLSQSELKKILGPGNVSVTVSLNPDTVFKVGRP
ncbi:cyclophilin-like fold protein [uncultured Bacteroides sp.]|uniref:cyclophilin-like fold protein n=1 Tax=uncultured Bacteroides sp. TaxID=162156 RepID=UPI002674B7DA|nr:cyclophilin-like fold protein [uncultured Bacteroides sp.]